GCDAQLDRLDAAPLALGHRPAQQHRADPPAAGGGLNPDLLDFGAAAAAGRDADGGAGQAAIAGQGEEAAAGIDQDRVHVLVEMLDHPALVAEERAQQPRDQRRVRQSGHPRHLVACAHSATPQWRTAASASPWAQRTRSSTGTYSSTVCAQAMSRGPQPIDGVSPKRAKVAASNQESSPLRRDGSPTASLASSMAVTIGREGSTSYGGMSSPQSIRGGCSASQG